MIDKETLKQFENIDFEYIRDVYFGHESFVDWAEDEYEKNSVSRQS